MSPDSCGFPPCCVHRTPAGLSPPLAVGDKLYGFCGGTFGRDSYDDKTVEAIGKDWVVAREDNGRVEFFGGDPRRLVEYRTPDPNDWA